MKARIKECNMIVDVEHQNLGDKGSDISFWCEGLDKSFSRYELDFDYNKPMASNAIAWEQKYNRLMDDYNILQAQYGVALKGMLGDSRFSNSNDIDYGMRAHELQLALISQGITEMNEIDRKVESLIDYQCSKSGDDKFNQLKTEQ